MGKLLSICLWSKLKRWEYHVEFFYKFGELYGFGFGTLY